MTTANIKMPALLGLSATPIKNFFLRHWLLMCAKNADISAEVESKKALQATTDAAEFQRRAAVYRSEALEYR